MKATYVGFALALLTSACASGAASDVAVSVRDSAGVEIVENAGDDASVPQWQLEAPRVSIGVLEGDAAYQLDGVRASMLHGGRILVLNGGSQELRFYDLAGQHVRTVGRKGGGPGEFENAYWLGPHLGDSIVVYDLGARRISVLDRDGAFGRSLTPEFSFGTMVGRLADGSFIVRPGIMIGPGNEIANGLQRATIGVLRVAADGQSVDTLATYPGSEAFIESGGTGGRNWITVRSRPFGLSTQVAAGGSLIYVGMSDAWAIDVLDGSGTLRRSIRRTRERTPVTPEVIDRYRESQLASVTNDNARRESERFYATVEYPDRLPAYGQLRVDDAGNLWVQDYSVARSDSLRWTVFDPSGRVMGRVAMPPRMVVHQIGPDFVLGRVQDDLDVEHVVLFGLSRGPTREYADAGGR